MERTECAINAYEKVRRMSGASDPDAIAKLVRFRAQLCMWSERARTDEALLITIVREALRVKRESVEMVGFVTPFDSLYLPFSMQERLLIAAATANKKLELAAKVTTLLTPPRFDGRERLRVGYLSADVRDHPVGRDLAVVLPLHDKKRFDIWCFAINFDQGDEFRKTVVSHVEHFVDVYPLRLDETVMTINTEQIDLLIDVMGYTMGARSEVLALRPAPMQLSWKGCALLCHDSLTYQHLILGIP